MTNKPISRLKDEPRGVWYENKSNLIPSKYGKDGRSVYVQPYVEQVYDRLRRNLYDKGYTDMDMFSLVSGFRSKEEQDALFRAAVQKYGSEEKARKWVAKVSPHNTGAAIDVNLGYSLKSENAGKIFDTPQYRDFASYAYHTYKMAPYEAEPWHWECGEACRENIEEMIAQENKPKAVAVSDTQVSPVKVPTQNQQILTATDKPPIKQTTQQAIKQPKKTQSMSTNTAIAIGVGSLIAVSGAVFFIAQSRKKKSKKYRKFKR